MCVGLKLHNKSECMYFPSVSLHVILKGMPYSVTTALTKISTFRSEYEYQIKTEYDFAIQECML